MSDRRVFALTVATGLLGAGAVTLATSRPWVRATADVPGLPPLEGEVTGTTLSPLAGSLGVVLLAAFGAVIATRGSVRRVLGLLVVAASLVVVAVALVPPGDAAAAEAALSAKAWPGGEYATEVVPWRWVALVGAGCCLVAGVVVATRGHRWAVMGARYEAPAAGTDEAARGRPADSLDDSEVWRALDRGHDPTRDA